MKNESKRYSLVQFAQKKTREYNSEEEYDELIKTITKNNKNKNSKFIFGDVTKEFVNGKIIATISVFIRLDSPMTLETIDNLTMQMENSSQLKDYYKDKIVDNLHPISISYFLTHGKAKKKNDGVSNSSNQSSKNCDSPVNTTIVLYNKDQKYMDPRYVKACFSQYADNKNYKFFYQMCMWFLQNRTLIRCIEDIRTDINKISMYGLSSTCLYSDAFEFFKLLTYKKDNNSNTVRDKEGNVTYEHNRLRDFAFFLKTKNNEFNLELPLDDEKQVKKL